MYEGVVLKIMLAKNYGFIAVTGGPDCFFHRDDLSPEIDWNETLRDRRVKFELHELPRGPKAINIRPAD